MNIYTKAVIEKKADGEFTAVASSEVEDRQGEVVESKGWQLSNFQSNPILLWMHDHTKPLGKASKVWVDRLNSQLKFRGKISTATEWGKAAAQLMEEGILNSFSVGFRPLEMDGNRITKSELFEISLVTVPANPEARLLAAKSLAEAGFEDNVIKEFTSDAHIRKLEERLSQAEEKADKAQELAQAAVKGLQYLNPHGSKPEVVSKRLHLLKVTAKAADKLIVESSSPKTVSRAKLMKRTSEKLIHEMKGDLNGTISRTT